MRSTTRNFLPETCSIAFKEWAGVCEALRSGRQSLILRKGGIEEGPNGFVPEHPIFWLYPTFVHQAEQGLKSAGSVLPPTVPNVVPIDCLAVVDEIAGVDDLDRLLALDDLHVWTEETVRKRFAYRSPGLWILGVRIYSRNDPWMIDVTPEQLGCKSWVPLETALPTAGLVPVRSDAEAAVDTDRRIAALGIVSGGGRTL